MAKTVSVAATTKIVALKSQRPRKQRKTPIPMKRAHQIQVYSLMNCQRALRSNEEQTSAEVSVVLKLWPVPSMSTSSVVVYCSALLSQIRPTCRLKLLDSFSYLRPKVEPPSSSSNFLALIESVLLVEAALQVPSSWLL